MSSQPDPSPPPASIGHEGLEGVLARKAGDLRKVASEGHLAVTPAGLCGVADLLLDAGRELASEREKRTLIVSAVDQHKIALDARAAGNAEQVRRDRDDIDNVLYNTIVSLDAGEPEPSEKTKDAQRYCQTAAPGGPDDKGPPFYTGRGPDQNGGEQ